MHLPPVLSSSSECRPERQLAQTLPACSSGVVHARVCVAQVYGGQSRIKQYMSLSKRSAIHSKFSQVVERLDELTKQAWILQRSDSPSPDIAHDNR